MAWLKEMLCGETPPPRRIPSNWDGAVAVEEQPPLDEREAFIREALEVIAQTEKAQPERLAHYQEAYTQDCASFRFDCERWGDFLVVKVQRGSTKIAASINLGLSSNFVLSEGKPPGADISQKLSAYREFRDGLSPRWKPLVDGPSEEFSGLMLTTESPARRGRPLDLSWIEGRRYYSGSYQFEMPLEWLQGLKVDRMARAAIADQIWFEGPKVTLFAPAGHGWGVYQKILAANKLYDLERKG